LNVFPASENAIEQENEIKDENIAKDEVVCVSSVVVCLEGPKEASY
jgi:hypothetical protein